MTPKWGMAKVRWPTFEAIIIIIIIIIVPASTKPQAKN